MMIIDIEVNGKTLKARKGETILTALQRNGIIIPTLCHLNSLFPTGACRICCVEVDGQPTLVPSCSFPIHENIKIKTHSPRVIAARKTLVELLLANHPDDCLYCIRNGNCDLQKLARELNIKDRHFSGVSRAGKIDKSSASMVREPAKCILCGRCVRFCDEVMDVAAFDFMGRGYDTIVGPEMLQGINQSSCINCGQCILVCPSGSICERDDTETVMQAIHSKKHVIGLLDSGMSVAIAEAFQLKHGKNYDRLLATALNKIGFTAVFDAGFGADIALHEMAEEWVSKQKNKKPLISNHCPAWIKHMERDFPWLEEQISQVLPPHQLMGKLIKKHFYETKGFRPEDVFVVACTSCTARKEEIINKEFSHAGVANIDVVLTTREVTSLIRLYGLEFEQLDETNPHMPFGISSSAGKLFTVSGGLTEGLIRSLFLKYHNRELRPARVSKLRNTRAVKEYNLKLGNKNKTLVAVSGLKEARQVLHDIEAGLRKADFIEILACPQGCVNGGGQPLTNETEAPKIRRKTIYDIDNKSSVKTAEKNPLFDEIYSSIINAKEGNTFFYKPQKTE